MGDSPCGWDVDHLLISDAAERNNNLLHPDQIGCSDNPVDLWYCIPVRKRSQNHCVQTLEWLNNIKNINEHDSGCLWNTQMRDDDSHRPAGPPLAGHRISARVL